MEKGKGRKSDCNCKLNLLNVICPLLASSIMCTVHETGWGVGEEVPC